MRLFTLCTERRDQSGGGAGGMLDDDNDQFDIEVERPAVGDKKKGDKSQKRVAKVCR